ncbi:disease resistance protein [Spatholobus suberectus]|nr:disease resistance protein [Spatholobus suberectus]
MTEKISQVIAHGKFDRISYRVASKVRTTPFCTDYQALDSRTSTVNEIKEALRDPEIYMIWVHGMGGVGKTTLVDELASLVKADGSFDTVVIATITHSPDVKNIQGQVADALFDRKLEKESTPTYAVHRFTNLKEWPKVDQLQKYHYIIIPWSYIDELPEKLQCPELKLLLLHSIVEDLSFAKLKQVKDVLYEFDEEGFPRLKNLHIQDSDELLHIINSRGLVNRHSAFPNLETLVLHSLNNMEEICDGPLPTQSFAKLKVQFPNLETLVISYMDDLKSIWPNQLAPNSFGKLKGIHIGDCKSLDYVFPISVAKELRQLQILKINECAIKNIVEKTSYHSLPFMKTFGEEVDEDFYLHCSYRLGTAVGRLPGQLFSQSLELAG